MQILHSIILQCVFLVLLFYLRTHGLVWTKTDYAVHMEMFLSDHFLPSSAYTGFVVLGLLLHWPERY